jgi:hypothetical protein
LYESIGSPLAGGHEHVLDERGRTARRRAFSPKINFSSTCIRYSHCFRTFARPPSALLLAAVPLPARAEAAVVPSAGLAMARRLGHLAALVRAVVLPVVVGAADVERVPAPEAAQLVEGDAAVHPAMRTDRNWTRASA